MTHHTHVLSCRARCGWIPAFAGMTEEGYETTSALVRAVRLKFFLVHADDRS